MRSRLRHAHGWVAVAVLSVGATADALAQDGSEQPLSLEALAALSLEDLLNTPIRVATKGEMRAGQTPAVVTIITADELHARGCSSLAEALRMVPGFYDVYDLVTHNVGIRGVNGGENASGSVLKLMINGQSVAYAPTTGNFFGEELIPIEAIDRIEVVRGPASALYGANAYLGVINVITRAGADIHGARLVGQGAMMNGHPGGGGGLVIGAQGGPVDAIIGASGVRLDRSGLGLPSSSPVAHLDDVARRAPSQADYARPISIFGRMVLANVLRGKLAFQVSIQQLDSGAEYQYFGPLTHDSRLTARNQNYRLSYELAASDDLQLSISGSYGLAGATSRARIDVGQPDYVLVPDGGATTAGAVAEVKFRAHRMLHLTGGVDYQRDRISVETFNQRLVEPRRSPIGAIILPSGAVLPGEQQGAESSFRNLGAFAQALVTPSSRWTGIVGVRLDEHNIYGANLSSRAGIVYTDDLLSAKLLYGSSFKAPSAEQLYAQPTGFGGILGNAQLRAQTAYNFELEGGLRLPGGFGEIQANMFVTNALGRVEFLPRGDFVVAANIENEWITGGEFQSRFVIFEPLRIRLLAGVARSVSRSVTVLGAPDVVDPLFPTVQVHLLTEYQAPFWALRFVAELSGIGPRSASVSNARLNMSAYDLKAYAFAAVTASTAGIELIPRCPTRFALRVSDLFDTRWVEPGFGGVDVPTQGRTVLLKLTQDFPSDGGT